MSFQRTPWCVFFSQPDFYSGARRVCAHQCLCFPATEPCGLINSHVSVQRLIHKPVAICSSCGLRWSILQIQQSGVCECTFSWWRLLMRLCSQFQALLHAIFNLLHWEQRVFMESRCFHNSSIKALRGDAMPCRFDVSSGCSLSAASNVNR